MVTSEEVGEFLAFTHVGTAAYLTGMLWSSGVDPATDREETVRGPMCGVGDDLVKEGQKTLGLENSFNEDRVGVGEAEERRGGCGLGLEMNDIADHGGMEWHDTQSVFYLVSSNASSVGLF